MTTFHGLAQTSYFKVNDLNAFRQSIKNQEVRIKHHSQHPEYIALISQSPQGWHNDLELTDRIIEHIDPEHVAVLTLIGIHHNPEYLYGESYTLDHEGVIDCIRLSEIYEMIPSNYHTLANDSSQLPPNQEQPHAHA